MARFERTFTIDANPSYCRARLHMYFESQEWPEHKRTEVFYDGTGTLWDEFFRTSSNNRIRAVVKKRGLPFAWYGLGAVLFILLTLLTAGTFGVIWVLYYLFVRDDLLPYLEVRVIPHDSFGESTHLELRATHRRLLEPLVAKIETQRQL